MMSNVRQPSTTPQLVHVLDDVLSGCTSELDDGIWDNLLPVGQWQTAGDGVCDLRADGQCDPTDVMWGTDFLHDPLFCTHHFFSDQTGYELVSSTR